MNLETFIYTAMAIYAVGLVGVGEYIRKQSLKADEILAIYKQYKDQIDIRVGLEKAKKIALAMKALDDLNLDTEDENE